MGRKILFSVDGSPSSNNAIEWGCSHVLRPDDLLYIVHIHTRPSSFYLIDSSLSALYQEAETAVKYFYFYFIFIDLFFFSFFSCCLRFLIHILI